MTNLRKTGDDQLAAHRWQASQAARPQYDILAAALERAGELAQLGRLAESRRVLEVNLVAAIKSDEDTTARRLAIELKPFLGFLAE